MSHRTGAAFVLLVNGLLIAALHCGAARPPAVNQGGVSVLFSPDGGCDDALVTAIHDARKTLDIAAYHITHTKIAKAIVDANRRGVSVRVIMDKSQTQAKYSSATYLHNAGVPVTTWEAGVMHNKFIIIDGGDVFTGSFNFTKAADEQNAENLLLIEAKPRVTAAYRQQFDKLLQASRRYTPVAPTE